MQLYSVLALAIFLSSVPALALEFKFRPSYLELHDEGIVQRVMPGELVEVPMGESSALEIETSPNTPREVRIKSKGECEFVIFGATSKLQDGGIMTASMDQETRKLDISWTRGEMKTPPQDFDKPAAVAFFTSKDEDLLRPLEFAGVRPFGYTDELEGRKPWTEKTLADLPPLGLPPPVHQGESEPLPQDWITFEDDSSSPEPLSIPAPLPLNKKRSTPSQLVFLEPSSATHPDTSSEESSLEGGGDIENSAKQDSSPSAEGKVNKSDAGGEKSAGSKSTIAPPSPSLGQAKVEKADNEGVTKTEKETDSAQKKEEVPESKKEATPTPTPNTEGTEGEEKPPQKKTKPTLYEIVMEQERRQEEVLKMIADVSNQVKILKEKPPTTPLQAQSEPPSESKPAQASPAAIASQSKTSPLSLGNSVTSPASSQVLSETQESAPAPPEVIGSSVDFEVEIVTDDSITVGGE